MRPPGGTALLAALALAGTAPGGSPAAAQAPELAAVDSLAAEGRVDEARDRLGAWWEGGWEAADRSERQRALWLRGRLTVDPSQARLDYQRLALEYPGGVHSADALLRLGQEAAARGLLIQAARSFERLALDYPNHPARLEARRWLDEHADALARAHREAARAPDPGAGEPEVDAGARPGEPDAGRSEAAADAPVADGDGGSVAVQLGAFSTQARAEDLAARARDHGFRVRLVRVDGSRLVRVRAGRFPDRDAARTLLQSIRDRGLDATVVTDAGKETPIR